MAEDRKVPVLGGYDYEFTSTIPEDWECLVCHLAMKDPVQIVGCGHRLCSICMESLMRHPSPTCPGDRQPLSRDKIFPDAACHRKILHLTVKCSYSGCSWTGELRAVEQHQSAECPFKVVTCPNAGCTEKLTKQDLHRHMGFECSWRKINCEYCQGTLIVKQKQKHFGVCLKFPVPCTNKCGLCDIPREKLEAHVRDECPATEVQCEYKNLGCEAVFSRSNAKSHSESQVERHLNLALHSLEVTQHQVHALVSLVKDQSLQIERLDNELAKVKDQSQQTERVVKDMSQQIERLLFKDKKQSETIERLEQDKPKIKEQSEQIEQLRYNVIEQSQQIERLLSKNDEQSQQIEKLEQSPSCSPFVWKISNFQSVCRRLMTQEQKVIFSEPFYLFNCGYKLRVKMDCSVILFFGPFSRRFDFSLYINVVPGEFDSMLSWPCKEKVRITLVDQEPCHDNRVNISRVIDFEKEEVPCPRPLKDNSRDYGFRDFVERDTLHSRSYIKDDKIFIMVSKE